MVIVLKRKNVMIIGAGWTGTMLVKKLSDDYVEKYNICCLIDDDPDKWGSKIDDIPIAGGREDIVKHAKGYNINEIIIALPSVKKSEVRKIIELCKETDCILKVVPNIYEIDELDIEVTRLRNVNIEDLLGREQVTISYDSIKQYIQGAVVLITGGGGSIGSELARQVAVNSPKKLIILDIYENNAYELQQELLNNYPSLKLEILIASVRNEKRIDSIVKEYKPDIIFHAAAHKHVPLMENSPCEAIKNNVLGTYNIACVAGKYKCGKVVLISTDKAVNPTNIMGASKRICEMIIQMMNRKFAETKFVAVRFGNVLGSNGTTLPLLPKTFPNLTATNFVSANFLFII